MAVDKVTNDILDEIIVGVARQFIYDWFMDAQHVQGAGNRIACTRPNFMAALVADIRCTVMGYSASPEKLLEGLKQCSHTDEEAGIAGWEQSPLLMV